MASSRDSLMELVCQWGGQFDTI